MLPVCAAPIVKPLHQSTKTQAMGAQSTLARMGEEGAGGGGVKT